MIRKKTPMLIMVASEDMKFTQHDENGKKQTRSFRAGIRYGCNRAVTSNGNVAIYFTNGVTKVNIPESKVKLTRIWK